MDRAAVALETPDRGAGNVVRTAGGLLFPEEGSSGDAARGAPRTGPVPPGPACRPRQTAQAEEPRAESDVRLRQLWLQLSEPDRQRFGHCFSGMVLKALGLRPCPEPEVKA
jgi:hypothetical protein